MSTLHNTIRSCAASLALTALAPLGLAQPHPDTPNAANADTLWYCWYNHDSTYRCRLGHARDAPTATPVAVVPKPPTGPPPRPRRSLYPKRGPLPPIVQTIHDQPASLGGRLITIPLFSPPRDPAFVAMLVQGVMCDIRPACRTIILRSAAAVAEAFEEDPARDD